MIYCRHKESIALLTYTPPPTLRVLSERISLLHNSFQHGDSRLTEEEEKEEEYDDNTNSSNCTWVAGYCPMSDSKLVLKAWLGVLAEFLGYSHPYIERSARESAHPQFHEFVSSS